MFFAFRVFCGLRLYAIEDPWFLTRFLNGFHTFFTLIGFICADSAIFFSLYNEYSPNVNYFFRPRGRNSRRLLALECPLDSLATDSQGSMSQLFLFFHARYLPKEKSSSRYATCCYSGKVTLQSPVDPPQLLMDLYDGTSVYSRNLLVTFALITAL